MNSVFFAVGVWAPTFFGHSNFAVKIFLEILNLQRTVDFGFFTGGVLGTNSFWSH